MVCCGALGTEIRLGAERRAGEMKANGERDAGGRREQTSQAVTLDDLSISHMQSSRWQQLADLDDDDFEARSGRRRRSVSSDNRCHGGWSLLANRLMHPC